MTLPLRLVPSAVYELGVGFFDRLRARRGEPKPALVRQAFGEHLSKEALNEYAAVWSPFYEPLIDTTFRTIASSCVDNPLRILDLGCGKLGALQKLRNSGMRVAKYTGLDLVIDSSLMAQRDEQSTFYEVDVTAKPTPVTGTFDLIVAINLLPYVGSELGVFTFIDSQSLAKRHHLVVVEPYPSVFWHINFTTFTAIMRNPSVILETIRKHGWHPTSLSTLFLFSFGRFHMFPIAYAVTAEREP